MSQQLRGPTKRKMEETGLQEVFLFLDYWNENQLQHIVLAQKEVLNKAARKFLCASPQFVVSILGTRNKRQH